MERNGDTTNPRYEPRRRDTLLAKCIVTRGIFPCREHNRYVTRAVERALPPPTGIFNPLWNANKDFIVDVHVQTSFVRINCDTDDVICDTPRGKARSIERVPCGIIFQRENRTPVRAEFAPRKSRIPAALPCLAGNADEREKTRDECEIN